MLTTNNTTTSLCLIPKRKCSYDNWGILPLWLMFDLRYLNNEDLLDLQTLALDSAKWDISSGRKWLYVHVSLLTYYRGELVVIKRVGRSSRLSALFINKTTSGAFPNGGLYKWPLMVVGLIGIVTFLHGWASTLIRWNIEEKLCWHSAYDGIWWWKTGFFPLHGWASETNWCSNTAHISWLSEARKVRIFGQTGPFGPLWRIRYTTTGV